MISKICNIQAAPSLTFNEFCYSIVPPSCFLNTCCLPIPFCVKVLKYQSYMFPNIKVAKHLFICIPWNLSLSSYRSKTCITIVYSAADFEQGWSVQQNYQNLVGLDYIFQYHGSPRLAMVLPAPLLDRCSRFLQPTWVQTLPLSTCCGHSETLATSLVVLWLEHYTKNFYQPSLGRWSFLVLL